MSFLADEFLLGSNRISIYSEIHELPFLGAPGNWRDSENAKQQQVQQVPYLALVK